MGVQQTHEKMRPLRASDVARIFNVSLVTVGKWADAGLLPSFRTPGGQRRFYQADVDAFIANGGGRAAS
jgi:excisionase family DNA binding protein